MAKGKLILICQSGGNFITKSDGTLWYEAGEANAVNVNHETMFEDLKLELAEVSNLDQKTISIKYFLPGNRRNLITLRNDKDLKRMIDFHGNSVTADIFVDGKEGFYNEAMKVDSSRDSGVRLTEMVNHIPEPYSSATHVVGNHNNQVRHAKASPDDAELPPVHASTGSTAATEKLRDTLIPSQQDAGASPPSSKHETENDSDYKQQPSVNANADRSLTGVDMNGSPADTVKKRRRTASWTVGALGPTIIAISDDEGCRQRRKRNNQGCNSLVALGKEDQSHLVLGTNDLGNPSNACFSDDALPEKLVASWKDCITGVGQDFKSVKEFREALQKYAIAHRFVYKLKKNDSNRASGICVEEGCPWSIHASWVPASLSFTIKKFNNSHSCGGESWKNAHPAKKLLVSVIKDKLRDSPNHKLKEIAKSISQDFGLELKYTQVRRGMEDAREQLHGSYKESYNRLPWFCKNFVEMNAGSLVKLVTNDEKRLQRLFVSFHSFVQSFQSACRPILFLDATSLKSKYQESLLLAVAVDADNGLCPVAFSIVDAENEGSWRWFFMQLKSAISTSLPLSVPITFVSDMEKGLHKSLREIFENCYHGYSMYHLMESFKKNLKGPFTGEGRGVLPAKFLAAAHAVRQNCFRSFMEQIRQISSNAYDWTIQVEPGHWTSYLFQGEQYNHIVENVAEPYAKMIDEIRESTIMQKIEALISLINEMINKRRLESSQWTTKLTPSNESKLQEAAVKAHGLRVFISSNVVFEVHDDLTHVVNIEKRECTCLEWKDKGKGIPCCHAIAAFNYLDPLGKSVYDYCSKYLTVESYCLMYSASINAPVPPETADDDDAVKVLPPATASRSTNLHSNKKEQSSKMEEDPDKRTVTCSKCKQPGHNKASCKASL